MPPSQSPLAPLNEKKKLDHQVIDTKEDYDCCAITSKSMSQCCQMEHLHKRLPILEWAPRYSCDTLAKDCIAGLTVGLTVIPQGIAYAIVAGLEPQYGLYSSFMGCFVYAVLGSCKDITIGPTAIMALMTHKYVESHGPEFAILLAFLTGVIITLLGVLHLGFLVEFISMPVTVGFTSAAAVTIASSQIAALLGIGGKSHGFIDSWLVTFKGLPGARLWDACLGIATLAILLIAKKMKDWSGSWEEGFIRSTASFLGLARNAIIVILATLLAFLLSLYDMTPFRLTGSVGSGLPDFKPPPFSSKVGNTTLGFGEMVEELGSAVAVAPLIAILESIAIAKAFSKGKSVDATQEMLALGICNIVGSFVSSFPTTGSFTRTAVNHASGVVTPAGGVLTGVLVILSLSFLTSTFYFIPKATLAGVIIAAMIHMIDYKVVTLLWRTKKVDLIPLFATLISCLGLGLEYGMLIGISVNILFILYNSARPRLSLVWIPRGGGEDVLVVTPSQSLVFPATDYIRAVVIEECNAKATVAPVVLDGTHVHSIDATMAKGLKLLSEELGARGHEVVLWRWPSQPRITLLGLDPSLVSLFQPNIPGLEEFDQRGSSGNYEVLSTTDDEAVQSPESAR